MKYLRLAFAILLAAFAQCVYADSIPTFYVTQVTMFLSPNDGSGDNVTFFFTGPGVNITGGGGMGCYWCLAGVPISDPNVAQTSQIFFGGFGTFILGGVSYDASSFLFDPPGPFDEFGNLNASTTGLIGPDNFQFKLILPTNGGWDLNFDPTVDQNGNPAFIFTDGFFGASAPAPTPEPATVGLMLTGLAGIAGIVKRQGKFRN